MANDLCPYCKGSKFIDRGYIEKLEGGHRTVYPYSSPCYCQTNLFMTKRFPLLRYVPDALPEDMELVHDAFGKKEGLSSNIIFFGPEELFLYTVKCFMMKFFGIRNYIVIEGSGIVEIFHVVREGTWLTTSQLNQYDLVSLLFTSKTSYGSLQACVADVLKNRYRIKLPTWVYAETPEKLQESKERSNESDEYLNKYNQITLGGNTKYKGISLTDPVSMSRKVMRDTDDKYSN